MNFNKIKFRFRLKQKFLLPAVFIFSSFFHVFAQPMSGSYTIGANASDNFSGFTSAAAALELNGISGPVIFEADPGTYAEHFVIHTIAGASAVNTITFQSAGLDSSAVMVEYNTSDQANNYVMRLINCSFMHFRSITFHALDLTYQTTVTLSNSNNITFSNVVFEGHAFYPTIDKMVDITGAGSTSNIIENCRFERGGNQLSVTAGGYNIITGNIFTGNALSSMYIANQGSTGVTITGNVFEGERREIADIKITECDGKLLISKNKCTIHANSMRLLHIDHCDANAENPSEIKNNFFSVSALNHNVSAIEIEWVSNLKVLNNNFNSINSTSTAVLFWNHLSNIQFYNNAYYWPEGNSFYKFFYAVDTSWFHSDHNAFYSDLPVHFIEIALQMTFEQWKVQEGFDLSSVFSNPQFADTSDLHVNEGAAALNGAGLAFPEVTDDIDGEPRDPVHPDIGADEFLIDSAGYFDIELVSIVFPDTNACIKTDSLVLLVTNHSSFPINNFDVKWWLYGLMNDSATYNNTIAPNDTIRVAVAHFNFVANTQYEFNLEISAPNGQPDNYFNDNTASVKYAHLDNVKIFRHSNPLCDNITELYIKNLPGAGVVWSTGSFDDRIMINSPGTYTVTVTGENGCVVSDSVIID